MSRLMIGMFELELPSSEKVDRALAKGKFNDIYEILLILSNELEDKPPSQGSG